MKIFYMPYNNKIAGDISICANNMNWIDTYVIATCFSEPTDLVYRSNRTGNISVFENKLRLREFHINWCINITGQLISLKNLKKLYFCMCRGTSVTGSKTDLYNGGANCSYFAI